jgi:hypothetical protein
MRSSRCQSSISSRVIKKPDSVKNMATVSTPPVNHVTLWW